MHLIIDGVDVDFTLPDGASRYMHIKQFLDYYDAEEIKGVEVMYSGKYQMRYSSRFLDPLEPFYNHAFVEVTTRGGSGPFLKKAVGTYVFRPLPFSSFKQFYSPKYKADPLIDMTDIRSTIHWEPNLITDPDGRGQLSFFTADNPSTYTVIIEGTDFQGRLGTQRKQISVQKKVVP